MLKPKVISSESGAEFLATRMATYGKEMNVHTISLAELHDAPPEWNFFKPLPDGKFFELIESIQENGLLVPLIVWERAPVQGGYTILSGHNRKRALKMLYDRLGDSRYSSAQCVVYRYNTLEEEDARGILVDCNWVQRVLSTAEKARAIYCKYVELGRQKRGVGKRGYDIVADHFGLKATQVYQYYKLSSLEDYWLDMLDEGKISIKVAAHLAGLKTEQLQLLKEWPDMNGKDILAVERCFTLDEVKRALIKEPEPMRELRMLVPEAHYDKILQMIDEYVKGL